MSLAGIGAAQPTTNGLFYGDGDNLQYGAPYAVSAGGSNLYVTLVDRTLYVALVNSRAVNDIIGSPVRDYTSSAGWGPGRTMRRLYDSEFASFNLTLGSGVTAQTWSWQQGLGGVASGTDRYDNTNWISGLGVSGGSPIGTPVPPGLTMASSFSWNMNTYATRFLAGTHTWPMASLADIGDSRDWTSPITNPGDPDNVVNASEGYPATGTLTFSPTHQWEWSMVYEWSVDLSSFTEVPLFVVSGESHHSPAKNGLEDDSFPDPPPGGPPPLSDFGDLPSFYPTLLADDGARHALDPNGIRLGTLLDSEPDGVESAVALGDDNTGVNDEDGVHFITGFPPGGTAIIEVTINNGNGSTLTGGYLSAFMDFNGDTTLEPVTLVSAFVPVGAATLPPGPISDTHLSLPGTYTLLVSVPFDAAGTMPSRWRITSSPAMGGASITGLAMSGEVEDYIFDPVLAVTLASFDAALDQSGKLVDVRWETAEEISNAGFHLYRGVADKDGRFVMGERLTETMIPAAGDMGGAAYNFFDPRPVGADETERFYYLEDYDLSGTITRHGPAVWTRSGGASAGVPRWIEY